MDIETIIDQVGMEEQEALAEGRATPIEQLEETAIVSRPRDLYAEKVNKDTEFLSKNYPHGSSRLVAYTVDQVVNNVQGNGRLALKDECRITKGEIKQLLKERRNDRAEAVRRQYMEDKFLPAIEIVIRATSPDELLNSEYALRKLDDCAIVDIIKLNGSGYTAGYTREKYVAHLGGNGTTVSDPKVRATVRDIHIALDNGRVRDALSMAEAMKKSIDEGKNLANDADYNLINRIVAYYGYKD